MDQVLHEMHANGDILLRGELIDPTSGRLYWLFRRAGQVLDAFKSFSFQNNAEDTLIIRNILQERAAYVVSNLNANYWTSTCVITMKKFQSMCNGSDEASSILSYLCGSGKAQYFSVRKDELIEGVKVSLESKSVNTITNLDHDLLQLILTSEKLQQQVDKINQHWTISRQMALVSFKSGNKQQARRHILQAKLFSENLGKCTSFLERVEEVLAAIADAESTKKVSEALRIGARALKDFNINVEEVRVQLLELDEIIADQKQLNESLEGTSIQSVNFDDKDIEEEFRKLELELADDVPEPQLQKPAPQKQAVTEELPESLSRSLSKLHLEAPQSESCL
ncbi:hypothetical protein AXF42_Ash013107 [Apostasia shenzhenica]|uniref:Charged multivesicular body protein 7 n=1 Tax=Apostasia shenzhenica TaxID=1088818 RepID=A0A2I0BD21_9ASPA|nr:hypothetical protein AXF42_Ash013107 [Apostasia shenzhenica]